MSESTREQINEAEKINLVRIINNMWKGMKYYWVLFVILILVLGAGSCAWTYANYSPVYTANATFTVSDTEDGSKTAARLVNTFPYLLKSGILQKQITRSMGVETVPGTISTEILGDTNMITLTVTSENAKDAYNVLQEVIECYSEVSEPIIGKVVLTMLDSSGMPMYATNAPSYPGSVIKGMLAGVALSLCFLIVYAFMRSTIYEEEDFKKMLNIDCICTIPQIVFKKRSKEVRQDISIYNKKISQTFLEAIRVLRARIEKDAKKNDLKVFLVTSASPGEGKSTIASNIAMSLSMSESRVVLVDCDLRAPSVKEVLNMTEEGPGLAEYLTGKAEAKDILVWNETYKIHVVPGSKAISDGSTLLDLPRMQQLIEFLKTKADYIILDTAPVGMFTDTVILAEQADASLFVVKQDYTNRSSIIDAISQLAESKVTISGCILNGAQAGIGGYGYKSYRYYNKYGNYDTKSHYSEALESK